MAKIKLLLDVVEDLRSLADSLQTIADSVANNDVAEEMTATKESTESGKSGKTATKKKAVQAEPEEKTATKQEEKPLTLEEVRAVLAEKSRAGYTAEVKKLLNKYGADKLSEINPSEYAALLADAEVL